MAVLVLIIAWIVIGLITRFMVDMHFAECRLPLRFAVAEVLGWPMVIALALWGEDIE